MVEPKRAAFDAQAFLASAGLGRRIVQLAPKETFFSQGDAADSIFYLQKGRAKVKIVSRARKEATITLLSAGDFVGEEALAALPGPRLTTAVAVTACTALKITREEMIRVMHEEHDFSDLFLKFLLARSMRIPVFRPVDRVALYQLNDTKSRFHSQLGSACSGSHLAGTARASSSTAIASEVCRGI